MKLKAVMSDVPSNRPQVMAWAPKHRVKRCVVALDRAMYLGVKPRAMTEYGWMRHLDKLGCGGDACKMSGASAYHAPRPVYAVAMEVCRRRTVWSLCGVDMV